MASQRRFRLHLRLLRKHTTLHHPLPIPRHLRPLRLRPTHLRRPPYSPPPPPPPPQYAAQQPYSPAPGYTQSPVYPQGYPPAQPPYSPPPYAGQPAYGVPGAATVYQNEASGQGKLMAVLSYIFPFLGPAIALATAKGDKFTKFHAWQAGLYDGALIVIWILYFVLAMVSDYLPWLVWLLAAGLGILAFVAFISAITGKMFKIPLLGQIADRLSG